MCNTLFSLTYMTAGVEESPMKTVSVADANGKEVQLETAAVVREELHTVEDISNMTHVEFVECHRHDVLPDNFPGPPHGEA